MEVVFAFFFKLIRAFFSSPFFRKITDDLYKNGLQRSNFLPFIELLKKQNIVQSLDPGQDYRLRALKGSEKTFFVSDSDTTTSMNNLFKVLASKETDDVVKPLTVRIKSRDVRFERTCGQILDSTFDELCGRPLWTQDYAKIAQVFHTVFIRDIPILNQKRKSEARRFITLIDTLYEHKIRVVASAEAEYWNLFQSEHVSHQERLEDNRMLIDDLGIKANSQDSLDSGVFSGEEELFAFDRTTSRLTEMQTKAYWNKWKAI